MIDGMLRANAPELATLDLLMSVAELGSLGQAASRHRLSQPAVSMKMNHLERQLGLVLLVRDQSGTRLTGAGQQIVTYANKVLATAQTMMVTASALRAEVESHLRVAASFTLAEYILGAWIEELRSKYPEVTLTLEVSNSAKVFERVVDLSIDIGFVEGVATRSPGVQNQLVGGDHLVVVVNPRHKWARRKRPVSGDELAASDLLTREIGSGTREVLEAALKPWGGLHSKRELGSTSAILSVARNGGGPAVLSDIAASNDLDAKRLVAVETTGIDLSRSFHAVWSAARPLSVLARQLLKIATP